MREGKNGSRATGPYRRGAGFRFCGFIGRFGSRFGAGIHENRRRRSSRFGRKLLDANNVCVGNFPAEGFLRAALIETLFEKNGSARIGDEHAGSGQANVTSPIMDFHFAPEKG